MIRLYTFFIFSAIFVVLGYILFILPRHDYVFQTRFLIIPENIVTASYVDNAINDISLIAQDAADGDKNVISHNAQVNVVRIEGYDIITISIFLHSNDNPAELQKSILKNILQEIDKYYSLSEDIRIETMSQDNVLQKTTVVKWASYILMVAIVLGVVSGALAIAYLVGRMREDQGHDDVIDGKKIFEKYNDAQQKNEVHTMSGDIQEDYANVGDGVYDIVQEEPANIEEFPVEEIVEESVNVEKVQDEKKENEKIEQKDVMPSGVPTIPGNLPVVDIDDFGINKQKNENNDIDNNKEPTEEELKARLNELLNGKL